MNEDRNPKIAMSWTPPNGRRKAGRPRNTWRRTLHCDFGDLDVSWEDAEEEAQDSQKWKLLVVRCAEMHESKKVWHRTGFHFKLNLEISLCMLYFESGAFASKSFNRNTFVASTYVQMERLDAWCINRRNNV